MADFTIAVEKTLLNEGGFYHNLKTGECSSYGISHWFLRSIGELPYSGNPDLLLKLPATPEEVAYVKALTKPHVLELYQKHFWKPLRLDQVLSQEVADKVFDLGVNCGVGTVAKLVQKALNAMDQFTPMKVDGRIGPLTLATLNAATPGKFLEALRIQAANRYRQIARNNPDLQDQLEGWLRRLKRA